MTTEAQTLSQTPARSLDDLHGDLAFWLFAVAELVTVGIGLVVFAVAKQYSPEQAQVLHGALHHDLALVNTLVLLTSGALIAMAVGREARGEGAPRLWLGALVIGSAFLVVKGYEFYAMADAGFGLSSSTMVSGYFLLTGFHYLHVALGLVFIASVAWRRVRPPAPSDGEPGTSAQEVRAFGATAGVFWHSLDLMWIGIFAVVYA